MAKRSSKREKLDEFAGEREPKQCQICGVITSNWQKHHFDYGMRPNTIITLCLKCHNIADDRRRKREIYEGHKRISLPKIESLVTKGFWNRETVFPSSEMMNDIKSEIEKLVIDRILPPQDTIQILAFEEPFKCILATKDRDRYKKYKHIYINLSKSRKKRTKIQQSRQKIFSKKVYELVLQDM